ncbi:MAG: hypothetical protein QNJ23_05540 [Woeseiaceae bacterium]|nr:hypothetical protein [Woeseiaceae bacterium]
MSNPPKFPPWMLALDVAGTIVLGLGLFGHYGGENLFSPFAIPLIIIGALLMLPLMIFLVTRATNRG